MAVVTPYTLFSYAVLIAVGALLYRQWWGGKTAKKAPVKGVKAPAPKAQPVRKEPKAKKPKAPKAPAPAKTTKQAPVPASYIRVDSSSEDEVDDKEFARQLTLAKMGTKVATNVEDNRIRSVKQTRAQEKPVAVADVAEKASMPSSTAGIDADDDQSAEPSPVVHAADATGVDDMLEAPASGPSILRLTDTEEKSRPKKAPKAPEPTLTKKQRQNKKKSEQKKADRAEDEKERVKLLEAQRRLARISEGRAAPDGTDFVASVNAKNSWDKKNGASAPSAPVAPLDTFDSMPVKERATLAVARGSALTKSEEWISSLPSEEEQLERVLKASAGDEWNTVQSKASKRNKKSKDSDVEVTQSKTNGSSAAKTLATQSSFAALNDGADATDDTSSMEESKPAAKLTRVARKAKAPPVEVEWDV